MILRVRAEVKSHSSGTKSMYLKMKIEVTILVDGLILLQMLTLSYPGRMMKSL